MPRFECEEAIVTLTTDVPLDVQTSNNATMNLIIKNKKGDILFNLTMNPAGTVSNIDGSKWDKVVR